MLIFNLHFYRAGEGNVDSCPFWRECPPQLRNERCIDSLVQWPPKSEAFRSPVVTGLHSWTIWLAPFGALALIPFFLLRPQPLRTAWGFLLPVDPAAARRAESERRFAWPAWLLCSAGWTWLCAVAIVPMRPATLKVRMNRPDMLTALHPEVYRHWLGDLRELLGNFNGLLVMEGDGGVVQLETGELERLREISAKKAPARMRDIPGPALVLGPGEKEVERGGWLPYPDAGDERAITRLSTRDGLRLWVEVQARRGVLDHPFQVVCGESRVEVQPRGAEKITVVIETVSPSGVVELEPLDGAPWNDRASFSARERQSLEVVSDLEMEHGLLEALRQTRVWAGAAPLLLSDRPERVRAWKGMFILMRPRSDWEGVYRLEKLDPDTPYRVRTGAALALSKRQGLFDWPLNALPPTRLAMWQGETLWWLDRWVVAMGCRSPEGDPVGWVSTLRPGDFTTPRHSSEFMELGLAYLGLQPGSEPEELYSYMPTRYRDAASRPLPKIPEPRLALVWIFAGLGLAILCFGLGLLLRGRSGAVASSEVILPGTS